MGNRVTLVDGDVRHFRRGMVIRFGAGVFRIRAIDAIGGTLTLDRPLWWRAWQWLRGVLRG